MRVLYIGGSDVSKGDLIAKPEALEELSLCFTTVTDLEAVHSPHDD
jgi:hypothetical protein